MLPNFREEIRTGQPLLLDGAMGTELVRAGLDLRAETTAVWNLTHPDRVRAVHRAYLAAGAQAILTNTFLAHLHPQATEVCTTAVRLAREVAGDGVWVVGSVGPGSPDCLMAAVRVLQGCDAVVLETQSDLEVVSQVVAEVLRQGLAAPLVVSFAFGQPGGLQPTTAAAWAERHRSALAAVGVNCGRDIGPAEGVAILRQFRQETDLPLLARPNAGTPIQVESEWRYPLAPADLAAAVPAFLAAGATLIGGCCGTTPDHIAVCRRVLPVK